MEKVLKLEKEQNSGLFGDLYEKKGVKEDSVKGDAVEPTLDSIAVSCKEALAEYLTDYSRIGNGESLFSHIDLVLDVVAMREVKVL